MDGLMRMITHVKIGIYLGTGSSTYCWFQLSWTAVHCLHFIDFHKWIRQLGLWLINLVVDSIITLMWSWTIQTLVFKEINTMRSNPTVCHLKVQFSTTLSVHGFFAFNLLCMEQPYSQYVNSDTMNISIHTINYQTKITWSLWQHTSWVPSTPSSPVLSRWAHHSPETW